MGKTSTTKKVEHPTGDFEKLSAEYKKLEAAHRETELRYRLILDNVMIPTLYYDLDGTILLINAIGAKNLNSTIDEIIGKKINEIFPRRFGDVILKRIRQAAEMGKRRLFEDFVKVPNGYRWFLTSVDPVRDSDGIINTIQMLSVDITQRKDFEKALEESEEKYRLMTETATIGIYQLDAKGKIVFLNDACTKILGYNKAELIDEHMNIVVPEEDIPGSTRILGQVMAGKPWKGELFAKHKRGHRVPANISMVAMKKDGEVLGVHGSIEDITQRKRAEDALRESEEKARALLNASTEIAVLIDKNGSILAINKAGADRINKAVDSLIGSCAYDYISPDSRNARKSDVENVIKTGIPLRNEHEDQGLIFDQSIYPMHDENGFVNGVSVFLNDVTERRHAEEELIESKKELERKSRDLEEVNTALRVLLRTREEDKKVLEEKVMFSVKDLIMPYLDKLKLSVSDQRHQSYLDIIESNLNDIVSPFMTAKATEMYKLTPTQIHVANFVKQGKSTKEIAEILHLSTSTIDSHRNTIRKKLGITKKNINLRSYLISRENV